MPASRTEYKGNPMIELKETTDSQYPFSFGVKKAKLIMDHLEEIAAFIEEVENAPKDSF